MKMLNYVEDFEKEFEKFTGTKPESAVIDFVMQLNKVGKIFADIGREDATQGRLPLSDEAFDSWGSKVFSDDPEIANMIVKLMRFCYTDGYETREGIS